MYQITVGGKETATEVQQSLKEDLKVDVGAATIRRVFKKYGLEAIVKQKKSLITETNRRKRLAWAKAHIKWTLDDWKRVVFSDETKICRFGSDGKHYAWKREGEPLLGKHVQQTVKHGGGDIKLWSCVTYAGVGYITKIEDTMTKEVYLEILKDDLYQTLDDYRIEPAKVIFQQDNDPKHRANLVQEWLSQQPFEVMQWPPQSPDLNPIENIWALLKSRLYRNYERPPKGMNEHWERVYKTWYDITAEECQRYINTMHQRCRDVIKAKGLWINY